MKHGAPSCEAGTRVRRRPSGETLGNGTITSNPAGGGSGDEGTWTAEHRNQRFGGTGTVGPLNACVIVHDNMEGRYVAGMRHNRCSHDLGCADRIEGRHGRSPTARRCSTDCFEQLNKHWQHFELE